MVTCLYMSFSVCMCVIINTEHPPFGNPGYTPVFHEDVEESKRYVQSHAQTSTTGKITRSKF